MLVCLRLESALSVSSNSIKQSLLQWENSLVSVFSIVNDLLHHNASSLRKWTITCFNSDLLGCGGIKKQQRKVMIVETTRAFVKLKQVKAAVSAGGIKYQIMLKA